MAERRTRYLDLAQLLVAGTVAHRRERTRQERLRQRDAAVAELMEISALTAPPDLPGPEVEKWNTGWRSWVGYWGTKDQWTLIPAESTLEVADSVEELRDRIALLHDEIARLEAAKAKKTASRSAADQFFKK